MRSGKFPERRQADRLERRETMKANDMMIAALIAAATLEKVGEGGKGRGAALICGPSCPEKTRIAYLVGERISRFGSSSCTLTGYADGLMEEAARAMIDTGYSEISGLTGSIVPVSARIAVIDSPFPGRLSPALCVMIDAVGLPTGSSPVPYDIVAKLKADGTYMLSVMPELWR